MRRTFIELPIFRSRWKAMGLNDDDLARLQKELLEDPKVGLLCRVPAASVKCGLLLRIEEKAEVPV